MDQEGRTAVEHGQASPGPREALYLTRLVAIGEIVRAHGLDGSLRVRPLTDRPVRFERLVDCVVWDIERDTRVVRRVEAVRVQGNVVLVKLAGVTDREAARGFTGRLLAVPETEALPLEQGCFYPWQLEGCRVETEDGTTVGTVAGIEHGPAQDRWVVSDGTREHLVPAVPEIVREVDLSARRVVIRPPEGLFDL